MDETFSDIGEFASNCRFTDCSHTSEPGGAVRAAIERHELSEQDLCNHLKLAKEAEFHDSSYVEG